MSETSVSGPAHPRPMHPRTAVECSFMAPGLGPWRPDMAPYVDEHGADLVALGLEWHAKMLLRIEIAALKARCQRWHVACAPPSLPLSPLSPLRVLSSVIPPLLPFSATLIRAMSLSLVRWLLLLVFWGFRDQG